MTLLWYLGGNLRCYWIAAMLLAVFVKVLLGGCCGIFGGW